MPDQLVGRLIKRGLDLLKDQAEQLRMPFLNVTRGYAGWLLTNREFLDEHDAIFSKWSVMVQRWGLNNLGIFLPKGYLSQGLDPTEDPKWPAYSKEFENFFIRWRLQGMAAPYLPIPLQPLMAGVFPISVVRQVSRAEGSFVCPISSRSPAATN